MPLFLRRENGYDTELAATCTTIREFDDAITRVAFGTRRPQPLPSSVWSRPSPSEDWSVYLP